MSMSEKKHLLDLEQKHYQPTVVESDIYQLWKEANISSATTAPDARPYSIVIPPPNITGRLHMGHALNNTVQDALIRFKRMDGFAALWIPGTDHAGISTQSVVKKHLDAEGVNYLELGRERMIARIWEWRNKYGDQILNQLRRMGCSCDWAHTRFTMDETLSRAVRVAFKRLYDEGLIYRGKYIVNWCPVDRTALSDDEVITQEGGEPGHLWHFKYPLSDGSAHVVIATTRPETMLGDTAVAVNPKDERYSALIGKTVKLPLVGRDIPIIADDYVDREFGSGCLKVTPAHDLNDFQIGRRHNLPALNVMNDDGTMGDNAPAEYHGMDRFACRDRVVEQLRELGLLVAIEERMTPVGRAQRSRAVIEYRLSDQWFVRMQPLAQQALAASEAGQIHLYPVRWEKIYRQWLINTRDWCISRQIWWGHRIPAWYHRETGEILVDTDTPKQVQQHPELWKQDEDVLDTWFSSALWPYSTMGWPEQTPDLARFYPTSVLSTAKDIIYFWVARMVMTGLHFTGQVPFRQVYFHPVICDAQGETMSKSKGNGIDPLHVIAGATVTELEGPIREARPENMEEMLTQLHKDYPQGFKGVGADALRLTVLSLNSHAQQVQLSLQKFEDIGQKFIDKLWNASRFAISNLSDLAPVTAGISPPELEDRWILGRLDETVASVRGAFDRFYFSEAVSTLYTFFWDDLCDWYVELTKPRLKSSDLAEKRRVQCTLAEVLSGVLRLLHPFIPFITEELWGHLHPLLVRGELVEKGQKKGLEDDTCALSSYPVDQGRSKPEESQEFTLLQRIVREIRNARSNAGVAASAELSLFVLPKNEAVQSVIERGKVVIERAARLKSCSLCSEKQAGMAVCVLEDADLFLNLAEHIDVAAEIKRNVAALAKVNKDLQFFQSKLQNQAFMAKAPAHVREEQEKNMAEALAKKAKIEQTLAELAQLRRDS